MEDKATALEGLVLALEENGLKTSVEESPTQNPKSEKLTGHNDMLLRKFKPV